MKLIVGCGYLGTRVARRWLGYAQEVHALTCSSSHAVELASMGISPLTADVTRPETFPPLPPASDVLFSVGHDPSADASRHEVLVDGLRNVLDALGSLPRRFVLISSTGVYGQTEGEWVDEDTPCNPIQSGGRTMLEAERLLQSHPIAPQAVILRLAGLYGKDRLPSRRSLEAGRPITASPRGYINLLHIDDAVSTVLHAFDHLDPPGTYCVSDGTPTTRLEFYTHLARLLDAPPPKFHPTDDSHAERSRSNKRVSNTRLLSDSHHKLLYPSYREGLKSMV